MVDLTNACGERIPTIGLGTYPLQGRALADLIKAAVKIGYRLFDTADDYRGETGIGLALKELKNENVCHREDLFIQTKISGDAAYNDEPYAGIVFSNYSSFMKRHSVEEIVREKVEKSLREMATDYLDSLLIHLPYSGFYYEIWEAMIKIKKEGKVRSIGVSNFHKKHIDVISRTGVLPAINEIYISPIGIKEDQISYNILNGIQLMTYSPLMDLTHNRLSLEVMKPIMEKYGKSAAQIVLRWNIDRNCIPLPKTSNPKRLQENFNIFDFSLTPEEIILISSMNKDYQYLPESTICPGI